MSAYASTVSLGPQPRTISGGRRDDPTAATSGTGTGTGAAFTPNTQYSPSMNSGQMSNSMSNISTMQNSVGESNNVNNSNNNSTYEYDPLEWKFVQSFGDDNSGEDDLVTAVEFDDTGDYLAVGDKAGRICIFEAHNLSRQRALQRRGSSTQQQQQHTPLGWPIEYKFYVCICTATWYLQFTIPISMHVSVYLFC
jgi:hypothetical protein